MVFGGIKPSNAMTTQSLAGQMTTFSIEAKTVVCSECGIPFSVPDSYQKRLRSTHETFYCPNGHGQWYPAKSKTEILEEKLRQKENELAQTTTARIQIESQLNKAQKKLKRVAEGQCPCCDKTYKHLAAHMKNKHPETVK